MFDMDFNRYMRYKLPKAIKMARKIREFDDSLQLLPFDISIPVFPLEINNNKVFVPTGTKESPAGVFNFDEGFVLIWNEEGVLYPIEADKFREALKKNVAYATRKMDIDTDTLGLEIEYILLIGRL